jgi:ribose 5-phosphate isomerase B
MKVYFAADHAGFELKNKLMHFVHDKGYKVEDCGAFEKDDSDDYPNIIACAAQKISDNP